MSIALPISDGTRCPCCGHRVAPDRILVNLDTNTITFGRRRAALRPAEAEMLSVIVGGYPGTVPLAHIYTALWGGYDQPLYAEKAVHVHVTRIRHALKTVGLALHNVRGRGYRISPEVSHDPA